MVHFLETFLAACLVLVCSLALTAIASAMADVQTRHPDVLPYTGPRPPITFQVTLGRPDDIKNACEILTGTRHNACAKFKTEKNLCWVFAPWPDDADDKYRFDLLDHEVGHCVSGPWHG